MNKRAQELWVDALRSGKYAQTCGQLRNGCSFCALGVLVDVWEREIGLECTHAPWRQFPSAEVLEWAGLDVNATLTYVPYDGGEEISTPITEANDTWDLTFETMADLIEKQL